MLATDKCYDAVNSASGDTVQRRMTYMELATSAQTPTDPCNVHGEPRIHLVGYGPSASTIGANRAGRSAARQLRRLLRDQGELPRTA